MTQNDPKMPQNQKVRKQKIVQNEMTATNLRAEAHSLFVCKVTGLMRNKS